jgi:hypothetical protein
VKPTWQLLYILCGVHGLCAQNAVLTSGGKTSSGSGSVTYSVGQIAYNSFGNVNGSISQGVLQPSVTVTAVDDSHNQEISCVVFPNPTQASVNLRIENRNLENISILLYDMSGRFLYQMRIREIETLIDLNKLVSGIYVLYVMESSQELKTFRIGKY